MFWIALYVVGMVVGFVVSALNKGTGEPLGLGIISLVVNKPDNGWWTGEINHRDESDTWVPICITLFWWAFFLGYFVVKLVKILGKGFFIAGNKVRDIFFHSGDKVRCVRNYLKKRNEEEAAPPISPMVKESYREPGPAPCVSCGAPTSIKQNVL